MADLQISQLPQLAEADLAAGDELAVVDDSASETKRITAKALVEKGVALIDAGSIPGTALASLGTDTVTTASITNNAVTADKIAAGAVGASEIADGTITATEIAANTLTAGQIAANAIGASELADDAVDTAAILDAAVTNDKIANGTIAYAKLNLSNADIPGAKIADNSITAGQIASDAVGASELANDAVDTNAIANLAVTSGKLAANSVTASKITDGVITGAKLVNDTITATQIAANAITASELADDAVDTNAILDDAVNAAKLAAGAVDTTALGAGAVTGSKIASTTITAANIAAGTITATQLAADSVGASEIAANAVGASELADDAVDTAAIVNEAVTNAKIADTTIAYAKLNLSDGDIPAAKIASNSLTANQIAANAVGASELANDAVDTAAIADDAVTGAKIAATTITGANIAATTIAAGNIVANTLTANEIAPNAIGASELADNAVDTAAIVNAAVTNDKIANTTIAYAKLNLSNGDIAGAKIADNSLTAQQIAANAIGASELANDAVDTNALADDAVTGAKIAAATITGANIATGTITATQLAADSVGTSEIAANAVGASELADDAVDTAAIANLAVTGAKIAASTITAAKLNLSAGDIDGTKITNDSITASQIAANAITASELADDAVDTAAIANNAVTAAKIAANAVGASELADDAVDTAAIADGAVTAAKISGTLNTATIADNAITTAKIADDAVTSANLGANAVDAAALANTAVGTAAIADAAVTAAKIGTGAVINAKLGAGAVTAAKITDGTITAAKLATANIDRSLNVASGNLGINNVISAGTSAGISYNAQGLITGVTALTASDLPVATTSAVGGVSIAGAGGLAVTGAGALSIAATTTGATATKVTFNNFGQITGTAVLVASDLPKATATAVGAVSVPTGGPLTVDSNGAITVADSGVTAGTGTKVTVDAKGRVTVLANLTDSDLPAHSAALITSGSIPTARIANDAITGTKLANASTTLFGSVAQTGFPTSEFTGQFFFDSVSEDLYIYDGNAYQPVTTLTKGSLVFGGTFNASTSKVASVTTAGAAAGLSVGSNVPTPTSSTDGIYLVVENAGTPSAPAPVVALAPPDYILGVTNTSGSSWEEIDLSQTVAGQVASNITFTPFGQIQSTNLQDALEEIETEKLAKAGGTVTGQVLLGNTATLVFEGSSTDAYQTTLGVVNPTTADKTILLPNTSGTLITTNDSGTVTSAMIADDSIVNGDIKSDAAIAFTKLAALTSAQILVGNGSNEAASVAVTGDIAISNAGVVSITANSIVDGDISNSAAISGSKIVQGTTSVLGVLQLTDAADSTSTTTAATPAAVKVAKDAADAAAATANAALPKAGGTLSDNLIIDNAKSLRFSEADSNGAHYLALKAPDSVTADITFTLPDGDGSAGQRLQTDGSGNLSWGTDNATDPTKLPLAGGTMSGAIAMGTSKITGLGDPTAAQDAATKTYVDAASTTGNAATATALATARTIGGVSFDGTANIDLPGVNAAGNQNTTGNAATATKFASAVTIGGVSFDGSANIDLAGVNTAGTQDTSGTAALATQFTVTANNTTNETVYPIFVDAATGSQGAETDSALTYNPSTGALTTTTFIGAFTGNVSGSSGSCTGNAATATALATARNIGGVSFDGTAAIDLPGVNTAGTQDTSGTAALATQFTVTANNSTNETVYPLFSDGSTGAQGAETDTGLTYNPSTGALTATSFVGAFTGNVTGNASGSSGSCTGNAATATALATARAINGVDFDGTGAITITAAAGTLTGTELKSTVVTSSLTSVGTLGSLDVTNNVAIGGNATITGNLTVQGTTTTVSSTTVEVADKNIELGKVASPSNTTADGGGITLDAGSDGDKTWNWVNSTSAWTSSEHIHIGDDKNLLVGTDSDLKLYFNTGDGTGVGYLHAPNGKIRIQADEFLLVSDDTGGRAIFLDNPNSRLELGFDGNHDAHFTGSGVTFLNDVTFTGASSNGLWDKSANAFVANLTGTASIATSITVADESSDTTCFPLFATAATGNLGAKSGSNLTFNSSSGALTATSFVGALTGDVTGNVSGTAATVTGAAQSAITSLGTLTALTVDGDVNFTGVSSYNAQWDKSDASFKLLDNAKIKIGSGDDLQLYFNSTHSYIQHTYASGNFFIESAANIAFKVASTESALNLNSNGSVEVFHNGTKKLETSSTGATVTGDDLKLIGSGHTKLQIETTGTGHATGIQIKHASGNGAEQTWQIQTDGSADGDLKLRNATAGSDAIVIDPSNNATFGGQIEVAKKIHIKEGTSGNTNLPALEFDNTDTSVSTGDLIGSIGFIQQTSGHAGMSSRIYSAAEDNTGGAGLVFQTGDNGSISAALTLNKSQNATFAGSVTSAGLTVDTNTLHVDATNNRVGIKTTSPTEVLDLGQGAQINLKVGSRSFVGSGYSTNATILGHSVKADTTNTVAGQMIVTETNSGGGAPSAIRQESGIIGFHTASSGTADAVFSSERMRIDSSGNVGIGDVDPDGNRLLIRAASTIGTVKGHIMLTGDSATNGQGPQIVFSESGSASEHAGAYIGHTRTGTNSVGNLVFATRASGGDANTIPTVALTISDTQNAEFTGTVSDSKGNLRSIPRNDESGSSAYDLVAADAGKFIYRSNGNVNIPASTMSEGDAVTIVNNSGSELDITMAGAVTLYNTADANTGTRKLAGRGMATILFASNNTAYISGAGLS